MFTNFAARDLAHEGDLLEVMKQLHNVRHLLFAIISCEEHVYVSPQDMKEINEDNDVRLSRMLDACTAFTTPWQMRRREARLASPPTTSTGEGR